MTLDEALKLAGDIHNGYAGRHPSDPIGEHVARKIVASLVESGYPVVPRKPTQEMVRVGTDARWQSAIRDADNVREIYAAMLDAALRGD